MTIHKPVALFLMLVAGVVPAVLSGCKCSRAAKDENLGDDGGSGPVSVHKMGGEIDVKDAPHGANLDTMGGDIHIGSVGEFAKVKTMGGNVTIDHANASVDATTMGGNITIKDADGSVQANTMAGDITAHLIGSSSGQRDVHLSSYSGTIMLIVPKDFPMDVRIKLATTKNADKTYEIIDHAWPCSSREQRLGHVQWLRAQIYVRTGPGRQRAESGGDRHHQRRCHSQAGITTR